jgi:hypothetical protein
MSSPNPFNVGRKLDSGGGANGQFLSIPPDESVTFVPVVGLDELISADMHEYWEIKPAIYHPCIGKDCPGCILENKPRWKGYLPVIVKGEDEVKIYPFTVSVYNQFEEFEDALDEDESIQGLVFKITRRGKGLNTKYSLIGTGKRMKTSGLDIPDFVSKLGATDEEEIWDQLEKRGFSRTGGRPSADDDDSDWS